jgi:signal transduction histidine kinase
MQTGSNQERQSLSQAYNLLMQAPIGFSLIRGEDHILELVNTEAMMYTGKGPEVIGRPVREILPEVISQGYIEVLKKVMETGESISLRESPVTFLKNGIPTSVYLNLIFQPYYEEEKMAGVLFISIDVTKQKELEQMKDNFVSMASHELRTPLTTIKAYAQMATEILSKKQDAETLSFVTKIVGQVNRLTKLIEDLLNINRISQGKLQYQEDFYDFNEMVAETVHDTQQTTSKHRIHFSHGENIQVYGDKERMNQVLHNLLSNAVKYSGQSNDIDVQTKLKEGGVELIVKDSGVGIAPEEHKKIFKQFYRSQKSNQTVIPGMGIGLYICHEIVSQQGGRIWVESEAEKGAAFFVWLPLDHRMV